MINVLDVDILKLAILERLEEQSERLYGFRPKLLLPEEREFMAWWKESLAAQPNERLRWHETIGQSASPRLPQ